MWELVFYQLGPKCYWYFDILKFFLFHNASIWPLPKIRKKRNKKGKKEHISAFELSLFFLLQDVQEFVLGQFDPEATLAYNEKHSDASLLKDPRSKDASQRYYFYSSRPYTNCYNFTLSSASPPYSGLLKPAGYNPYPCTRGPYPRYPYPCPGIGR
jgi:hypothetical protein